MSVRWPDLELLRRRDGDLITLSPLAQARARDQMTAALRTLKPALAHLDDNGPDAAIIDALAACIQIMGFYHDRFLTESKLGSAQLIDDLGKIVALIGYRPLPAVAATAHQFFEAITAGIVEAPTQVAGKLAGAPSPVTFETTTRIEVSPEHNRMALSPLITRSPGALRAVITQPDGSVLPTDDFRPGTTAMIADAQGLELAPVAGSRSRGVAFGRALTRSHEQASTVIERTTVLRHLRFPGALTPDLVAFEVSEAPILHLPSVAAPEVLTSTLEIFVLRDGDDAIDPSEWAATLRYREVADFSASEAADPHYRTFVDDALHTWIILRRSLGAQQLLDDQQLSRVYARFEPAIGSVLPVPPPATADAQPIAGPSPLPDLSGATLGLEPSYFDSSLVLPSLADRRVVANATWAMADRDLGLIAGDSILIQDASGSSVRTLIDRPPGASPRLLRWASDDPAPAAPSTSLPQAHDPITSVLDPASARIGSLTDAAAGDAFPTWSEFYAQLRPLGPFVRSTDLPIRPASPAGVIEHQRVVAAGAMYLVVRDATHIAVGDFFVLGRRLTEIVRQPPASGNWRWSSGEPAFDPRTPWLNAEVLQALEVRGNVVRLATPVSQDYVVDRGRIGATGTPVALSELVVLPGVGSVASGDQLRQTLTLSTQALFKTERDGKLNETSYRVATLDPGRPADELRRALVGAASTSKQDLWDVVFLAVAGAAEVQTDARWEFDIVVRGPALRAPADQIASLEDDHGNPITTGAIGDALKSELKLRLVSADAARSVADAADRAVVAVLADGPVWTPATGNPPDATQFWVLDQTSFDLVVGSPAADRNLVGSAATLVLGPDGGDASTFEASWDATGNAPRVKALVPQVAEPFDAVLISSQGADLAAVTSDDAVADWLIPASRFADPEFATLPAGTLVAASDSGEIVADCRFAPGGGDIKLDDVRVVSSRDPLRGATTAWAVVTRQFAQLTARASWVYTIAASGLTLPPSTTVRLALIGERNEIVDARTSADGRTATVDPAPGVRDRDLGFELDAVCALEGEPLPGARIVESTIWAWRGIEPPLADLPEAGDSRFLAVLASRDGHPRHLEWQRSEVWWDPERRTLRLPTAPLDARPSDLVRLVQLLAPSIARRQLAIHYDLTTDRSFVALAMPPGWPSAALAPAPVVIATARDSGETEVHDLVAPVEVSIQLDGRARWTLQLAGDVRDRWTDLAVALRDWSAPGERGLAVVPLWQVEAAAWRAPAAPGPVVLIVTLRDAAGFLALAAMPRLDGDEVALAPLGPDDEFPPAASVASLDIAVHAAMTTAEAPLALHGSTQLEIDDAGDQPPGIIAVAFDNGTRWQPIRVIESASLPGGRLRYELDGAYVSLFPEGLPSAQRVRLCYATTALATGLGATPAAAAIPHTVRLRLPGTGWTGEASANAAVFHQAGTLDHRVLLDARSAPRRTGDALVIELAVDADRLGEIFDDHGVLIWNRVDLAQRWRDLHRDALVAQPLRVALGESPYELVKGDVVTVSFGDRPPVPVTVLSADNDVVVLDTLSTLPVLQIGLHGLRTYVDPADYAATLDLAPSSSQPPWLLSFSCDPSPSKLLDTLLPYDAAPTASPDGSRQVFRFSCTGELVDIFRNAGDPQKPLYLLTNERDELRRDFYTGSGGALADDLGHGPPPPPTNFLDPQATAPVQQLVVTASAWAARQDTPGPVLDKPRPVIVSSIRWTPPDSHPRMPADQFPELVVVSADTRRVPTGIVLQSSRFNSGNFIARVSQGTAPATAAAIIASALRVSAQPLDRNSNPVSPDWKPVGFASLDELGHIGRPSGSVTEFEGLTYRDAVDSGLLPSADHLYAFSTSFSPTGTCTLHFLFVDKAIVDTVRVRIEAQYDVDPGRVDGGLHDPIYPLETPVVAFDPAHQLALLAPGALKPGALVFVRVQQRAGDIDLQWTSVASVTGPVVDLASPIAYDSTAVTEPIAVTGIGKLTSAAQLDAEYYTTVAKAKLVLPVPAAPPAPPAPMTLPLRDRLPLRAIRTDPDRPSLVSSLVPGDVVLVFDERWRSAWADHRGADTGQPVTKDWKQWPDRQYEAVVKRVDPDTGLVVLAAPLPDSVQIGWTYDPITGRLTAVDEDVASLRVLPCYRAPVQGPRVLAALGSGSAQKFARFTSSLDTGTGSADIPVLADGVTTGNLEVLAFDPVKAAWSRWLRYDRLSRAGKKDPAVTLGFRPASAGQIPVSVTFGDGVTGQLPPTGTGNIYLRSTTIGAANRWLAAPRNVRIVALPAPGATSPIARQPSLTLRLETAAPQVLSGAPDLGSAQWRSALALTVARRDGAGLELREITKDEAAGGVAGFVLDAQPGAPPGMVDAYVYTPTALATPPAVVVQQAPGTQPWTLDRGFYQSLSDQDLTVVKGARSLQLLSTTGLRTGSRLAMFHDDASPPDLVRIASVDPPTWSATLVDPLPRVYDLARSFIRGNLVEIIQGVVETSTLGSSDGTTPSLRLPLPLPTQQRLLHVVDPDGAPRPDITVRVAAQRWDRVLDFTGQAPTSRVWRLDIDAGGDAFVVFGDGVHGAIPPAGRDTIAATVRLGNGAAGNLAAGAITKLVSGNLAIKATTNITPSAGGSAGDDPPTARDKAFAHTLPGERVVSAADCVRAAIGESGVINAALDPTAPSDAVRLVVAMEDRRDPTPADITEITRQVRDVMPAAAAVALEVVAAHQTPVYLVIELGIAQGAEPGDVFAAVTTALGTGDGGLFAAAGWEVGEPLRLGTLYDTLFQIDGVAHARVLWVAGKPLADGAPPPASAPDIFDPGSLGVVRCDNDPAGDPFGRFGTFRLVQAPVEPIA
jgi:hypothetical protein